MPRPGESESGSLRSGSGSAVFGQTQKRSLNSIGFGSHLRKGRAAGSGMTLLPAYINQQPIWTEGAVNFVCLAARQLCGNFHATTEPSFGLAHAKQSKSTPMDLRKPTAIIVGGGPVGLMAALGLTRANMDFILLERRQDV